MKELRTCRSSFWIYMDPVEAGGIAYFFCGLGEGVGDGVLPGVGVVPPVFLFGSVLAGVISGIL